jgi:hypothetical protein
MTETVKSCSGQTRRRDEWIVLGSALFTLTLSLATIMLL